MILKLNPQGSPMHHRAAERSQVAQVEQIAVGKTELPCGVAGTGTKMHGTGQAATKYTFKTAEVFKWVMLAIEGADLRP
jgi:hypothetical protein